MYQLQRQIERLKRQILALGAMVEENLREAIRAIECRDVAAARHAIATDATIDQREVDIEEECLKILALYQPVARDLRFIVAVIKINNELERIGDLGVNLAERAIDLADAFPIVVPESFTVMAERTQMILERALDALVRQDASEARRVLAADDEIDLLYSDLIDGLKELLRAQPEHLDAIVLLFNAARHLERLADHATNIGEDVLYLVEGDIHRHQSPQADPGGVDFCL